MRKPIWKYVKLVIETLPLPEPIFEFGAFQVEEAPQNADLRPLLAGKDYVGCDMRAGPGVDRVLDLHAIDLPDNSVGTVFLMDTLEHVEYPHRAMEEVHRILRPDGLVVMSSVLDFFIHATPNDFWRYTPDGFRSLLKPFAHHHISWYGPDYFPQSLVAVAFKGHAPAMDAPAMESYLERCTRWAAQHTAYARKIELELMVQALEKARQDGELP